MQLRDAMACTEAETNSENEGVNVTVGRWGVQVGQGAPRQRRGGGELSR